MLEKPHDLVYFLAMVMQIKIVSGNPGCGGVCALRLGLDWAVRRLLILNPMAAEKAGILGPWETSPKVNEESCYHT